MSIFTKLNQKRKEKINKTEDITVDKKHLILRIILFVVFLAGGITGIVIGCTYKSTHVDKGWTLIESSDGENSASNFVLNYYFSSDNKRENAKESKELTNAYTTYCNDAYIMFNPYKHFNGVNGVFFINAHPNTDVKVETPFYNTLKKVKDNNTDALFLAPIYDSYENLFNAKTDAEAKEADPYFNNDLKDYYSEIKTYINNGDISLELKEDNIVRLNISDSYLSYCNQNGISNYFNFNYLYNAASIDYIADKLIANNFKNFKLYSYEGYFRIHLADSTLSTTYIPRTFYNNLIVPEANATFNTSITLVEFKTFPITELEDYYLYDDKTFAHHFINDEGLYSSCTSSLYVYEKGDTSALDLLLKGKEVFVQSSIDVDKLKEIGYFIFNEGSVVKYNDEKLEVKPTENEDFVFTKELI